MGEEDNPDRKYRRTAQSCVPQPLQRACHYLANMLPPPACIRPTVPPLPVPPIAHGALQWLHARTCCPTAFSSTRFMKRRTTGKLTSASSSARLISLRGSLTFSGESLPSLETNFHAFSMLRLRLSNIAARVTRRSERPLLLLGRAGR